MNWLISTIGAALVALIVGGLATLAATQAKRRRTDRGRTRHLERDAGLNQAKAITLFETLRRSDALYRPANLMIEGPLPIVVNASLVFDVDLRDFDATLRLGSNKIEPLPVDQRVIERRLRDGAELWDDDLVYVSAADLTVTPPAISLNRSKYFPYATAVDRTVSALWGRHPERSEELSAYLSVSDAFESNQPRLWISGATVTLLDRQNGESPQVIIHRRSSKVVNAPGVRTVAPVFGCDAATIGENRSRFGLVLYNLAREHAEELFDREDLVRELKAQWYNPDQIVDHVDEVRIYLDEVHSGLIQTRLLGMSVNPKDCDLSLALLSRLSVNSRSARLVRQQMRAGWEAEPSESGDPAVELLDLFDPKIDRWAAAGELYQTSVFALDRARAVVLSEMSGRSDRATED